LNRGRVRLVLSTEGRREEIVAYAGRSGWTVERGGERIEVQAERLPDGRFSLILPDGRQICGRVTSVDGTALVRTRRGISRIAIEDPLRRRRGHSSGEEDSSEGEEIRALMPGRVVDIAVAQGVEVESGALILVLEAMKMQNEIRASRAGLVLRVAVGPGDAVDGGALLVKLGPLPVPEA
jgi:biotin carboxyl carrier protein